MIRAILILALTSFWASTAWADAGQCLVLRIPLDAGKFLAREMAEVAPCREEQPRLPIRYDRAAEAPVLTEALAAGTYLGRLALKPGKIAAAGEKLQLVIRSGPVTIFREVTPVQGVRSGERTFVKTGNGEVLAARFIAAEEMP